MRLPIVIGRPIDATGPDATSTPANDEATLDASKFNRHTFWCGQSGSGKTYALGVVVERLLLGTGLPLVIFDPNADFVGLGTPRDDAPPESVALLAACIGLGPPAPAW